MFNSAYINSWYGQRNSQIIQTLRKMKHAISNEGGVRYSPRCMDKKIKPKVECERNITNLFEERKCTWGWPSKETKPTIYSRQKNLTTFEMNILRLCSNDDNCVLESSFSLQNPVEQHLPSDHFCVHILFSALVVLESGVVLIRRVC